MQSDWKYLLIWEFLVRPGMESQFEAIYGSTGDWAELFRSDPAYIGTTLVRDPEREGRYVTLDFWASAEAYHLFRKKFAEEYKAIDERCEDLTESERELGAFARVEGSNS